MFNIYLTNPYVNLSSMKIVILLMQNRVNELVNGPYRPNFLKFGENHKTAELLFTVSNFFKKDKNQQKICKKTRSNSKVTSEEISVKPSHLDW
jgi:hypothetical protein